VARLTADAAAQFDALLDYYMERNRDDAIRRLRVALGEALTKIDTVPDGGRTFPGPYRGIGRWPYRWIKVHRYWFAYAVEGGDSVITNIFFESADIENRLQPPPAG